MHVDIIYFQYWKKDFKFSEKRNSQTNSLNCLYLGSLKTRFEICKDEDGWLKFFRAIQGHSGGIFVSPRLMNYEMIPYTWKEFIYHVGRARDQYSVAVAGLVAGGKERKGRQTIFFTPLDPFNSDVSEAELITDFQQRKLHYQIHWRPEHDASWRLSAKVESEKGSPDNSRLEKDQK